jgi:hypothetical protein
MRNACSIFVRKVAGKIYLGRPRRRSLDNMEMYLGEISLEWIDPA